MMFDGFTMFALIVLTWSTSAFGQFTLTDDGNAVTIRCARYTLTFDRSRGGAISRMGDRDVVQADHADDYRVASDGSATVAVAPPEPARVMVTVSAFPIKDGRRAPSSLRFDYRYVLHAKSSVISVDVTLRQDSYVSHADVSVIPSWREVSLLDFGGESGYRGPMSGALMNRRILFIPGTEKIFDVPTAEAKRFAELTRLRLATTGVLLADPFDDRAKWVNISGSWRASNGVLNETSPSGQNAWTVAGSAAWDDYVVEAEVKSNDSQSHALVCARWQDEANHYELAYLGYPARCLRLERVVDGKRMTLAEVGGLGDLTGRDRSDWQTPFTRLALAVQDHRLRGYMDDRLVLEAFDTTFATGRVGLGAANDFSLSFRRFSVHGLEALDEDVAALRLSSPPQRHAFYRDESGAAIRYELTSARDAAGVTAFVRVLNEKYLTLGEVYRETITVGSLRAGVSVEVHCPLQPALWRSGDYTVTVKIAQGERVLAQDKTTVSLRRRPNPDRMLINAWDMGEPGRFAAAGFNQLKVKNLNTMSRWNGERFATPDNPRRLFKPGVVRALQQDYDLLDECIRHGMWGYIELEFLRRVAEGVTDAYALKRDGKSLQDRQSHFFERDQPRPNPWHPANVKVIQDHFREELKAYADHPAWHATLINSESIGTLDVYGNPYFLDMARRELGFDVPADATGTWGVDRKKMPPPKDGIVASDDRWYRFYRWWWERGEGEGELFARVVEVIKDLRPDVLTWNDPALRQPFVRGRLRGLDQILNWSYLWPLPERFPMIADELRLARVDDQQMLFMIQLIVWGDVAIPMEGPHWSFVKRKRYLPAHSPALIREGTWLALSRGVTGLSYHGVRTIDPTGLMPEDDRANVRGVGYQSYMYSNPNVLDTIRDLSQRVVRPYGMAIKRMKPTKGQVLLLLSTANAVMTRSDPESLEVAEIGRMYAKLQVAHVPVDVAYEIDLEEGGLDGYKAIALPGVRVLPRHLYDMIHRFNEAGGIVLCDKTTVPSFPDTTVIEQRGETWDRGEIIQRDIMEGARAVHEALDGHVERIVDCDSPSVILSTLEDAAGNRLVFVMNALKQAGDYLGGWGRVLDDGVPQEVRVKLRGEGAIVDVLAGRTVQCDRDGEWRSWQVALGPGEGRMFVVLAATPREPVIAVGPARKGAQTRIAISISDSSSRPFSGLLPLRVDIHDSQQHLHDYSDHVLAVDGQATVSLPIAVNEPGGWWRVTVRELYTARETTTFFEIVP